MDWQTIITSITASSLITAGIIYLLKRSFDKTLELQIEKLKEQNKVEIQESIRRQSLLYDMQFENLKILLSLTYRLRNLIRDILKNLEKGSERDLDDLIQRLYVNGDILVERLYAERAILPKNLFDSFHDIKKIISVVETYLSPITSKSRKGRLKLELKTFERIEEMAERIDKIYIMLADEVHKYIGTNSIKNN